jgi:hypothetical protein
MKNLICILLLIFYSNITPAKPVTEKENLSEQISILQTSLKEFNLILARETLSSIASSRLSKKQWLEIRDIIHHYPQIGLDYLLKFDSIAPLASNKFDRLLQKADDFMLKKNFRNSAIIYQYLIKEITKNKNYKNGRNYQLYWTLIHSLGRAFYSMKQFDSAALVYRTIPSSYPFFKQVQFELMWTYYLFDRLEYSLGSMATMGSGVFSKIFEPEAYLLQYYIYKRMCRDEEVELIKSRVQLYLQILKTNNYCFNCWLKNDVETLEYLQILETAEKNSKTANILRNSLERRMKRDVARLIKEFELVQSHIELDSGKNSNLKPVKQLLFVDQLLSTKNEKWTVEDGEIWLDELGKQVFIQKDLCKKPASK